MEKESDIIKNYMEIDQNELNKAKDEINLLDFGKKYSPKNNIKGTESINFKSEFSSERKIIIPDKPSHNNNKLGLKKNPSNFSLKDFLEKRSDDQKNSPNLKKKSEVNDLNMDSFLKIEEHANKKDKNKNNGSLSNKNLRIEPLSNFDEQLLKDFDPQELLSKGEQRGFSKWIDQNGDTVWKECIILGFNPEKNKFLINWINSDMKKEVNRLNLILPNENEEEFKKRVDLAMEKREKKLILLQTLGMKY
jgi:hypothetical protein